MGVCREHTVDSYAIPCWHPQNGPSGWRCEAASPSLSHAFSKYSREKGHEEKCVKIQEHGMMVGWPLWAIGQVYLSSSDYGCCCQQLTFVIFIGRCAFGWLESPYCLLSRSAQAAHRQWLPRAEIWGPASLLPMGRILQHSLVPRAPCSLRLKFLYNNILALTSSLLYMIYFLLIWVPLWVLP